MFSEEALSDEFVARLFGEETVLRVWRKEWDAYPVLTPVTPEEGEGDSIKGRTKKELAPVRLDQGSYYVNGFERLISTMETEVSLLSSSSVMLDTAHWYLIRRLCRVSTSSVFSYKTSSITRLLILGLNGTTRTSLPSRLSLFLSRFFLFF